ncbi:hypothetical protein PBI_EDMUNDO_40 [Arthrobacter phage Edmundo]|nr:hypothetical protein PBI_EDMUNDO_40 [Arthrobacter phage Edmundo]
MWVEGKGFVRPSIARALAKAGRIVDWNRWSPGSGDDPKNMPYID